MKHIVAVLVGTLLFVSSSRAETPCDFTGISVGDKMSPAQVMAALGVTNYKMNPPQRDDTLMVASKIGLIAASELEDWAIGPYCTDKSCRVPYGVTVGSHNTPVNVFVAFREGLVTDIEVSFGEMWWDEIRPILDQKYGADWNVERWDMAITDFETKKVTLLERISLNHISNGANRATNDHCQIAATNLDIVFEHKDVFGPYHSIFSISLISKNF